MGLLDDAIREHLELKRRRGADTTEVARLEHEAFGPVRRGEDEPPTSEQPHAFSEEAAPAAPRLQLAEDPFGAERSDVPEAQHEPPRPQGDPADALPHYEPVHHEPEDELFVDDDGYPAQPEPDALLYEPPPASVPPVVVDEPVAQPTRAFDPDEVRAATEAAHHVAPQDDEDAEDVLEETPEFLQETPEHDRLWFEQRPPRDFDF